MNQKINRIFLEVIIILQGFFQLPCGWLKICNMSIIIQWSYLNHATIYSLLSVA